MELFVHITRGVLLASASSTQELGALAISRQNAFTLRIAFCADASGGTTPITIAQIPPPYTRIVISARPADRFSEPGMIFFSDAFVASGSGPSLRYTTQFSTHTAAAAALFEDNQRPTYPCLLDIDLLVSANPANGRLTLIKHRPFLFYRTLWAGPDDPPSPSLPHYPPPSAIPSFNQPYGNTRITPDGGLEIKDEVSGVWRRVSFHNGQLSFTQVAP